MFRLRYHKKPFVADSSKSMLSQRARRAHPAQKDEGSMWLYAASPRFDEAMLWYAMNVWVYTAVSRLATTAADTALTVVKRDDQTSLFKKHGLIQLLGEYGQPNDNQDAGEFLEQHISNYILSGNSFWLWVSLSGGRPNEVHNLDPRRMQIVPATEQTVLYYEYRTTGGHDIKLSPEQVTHFKKFNPVNRYWGISAFEALRRTLYADNSMEGWNQQAFSKLNPYGIVVVPKGTNDKERIEDEYNAKGGERRTLVLEGEVGSVAYLAAGTNAKDMDFVNGRLLTRQSVYEALELPLGLLAQNSTEANARVQERIWYDAIDKQLNRTAKKITSDAMHLWPSSTQYAVRFTSKRRDVGDNAQLKLKVEAMDPYHTINEIRAKVFDEEAVLWGEKQNDEGSDGSGNEVTEEGKQGNTARPEQSENSDAPDD